jgi:dTDP-4-dehydrorhamnose 3,5-epimerase-like enzyme
MKIIKTEIPDVLIFDKVFGDDRGFFMESLNEFLNVERITIFKQQSGMGIMCILVC